LQLRSVTASRSKLRQSGLRFISFPRFLKPFPSHGLSPPLLFLPFAGGDDLASGGAICHVFAKPFAGDEHPPEEECCSPA